MARRRQGSGYGWIIAAALMACAVGCDSRETDPLTGAPAAVQPQPAAPQSPEAQRAAVDKFTGMPGIRHVEWLDGDFIIAAVDNGQSWQPVAHAACAWIREQGLQGAFAVVVLEAGALRNKQWEQMARARCA